MPRLIARAGIENGIGLIRLRIRSRGRGAAVRSRKYFAHLGGHQPAEPRTAAHHLGFSDRVSLAGKLARTPEATAIAFFDFRCSAMTKRRLIW